MKYSQRRAIGITLIELLVVLTIIGILAAIAYPSYNSYVLKTHRTTAKAKLLEIMDKQQNYYIRKMTYSKDLTDLKYNNDPVITDGGRYKITAENCPDNGQLSPEINVCVLLTATAIGVQASDGYLALNSAGGKTPPEKW